MNGNETSKVGKAIGLFVQLRNQIAAKKKAQQAELAPMVENLSRLEGYLLNELNQAGVTSMRSASGTVYKATRTTVGIEDWDTTLAFIQKHNLWELLERRVAKKAVEDWMEEKGVRVPGTKVSQTLAIGVRSA